MSPILEVYQQDEITGTYTVVLGLNPLGQALCRRLYDCRQFETVLLYNSPQFSTWNRYPGGPRPPVVPVHGMVSGDLMIVFGDVMVSDYEWATDLLFHIHKNVNTRSVIAAMTHDGPTCGLALTPDGGKLLDRMGVPVGMPDFYDGLVAPLISVGGVIGLDVVALFIEATDGGTVLLQTDYTTVTEEEVDAFGEILTMGLGIRF